MVYCNSRSPPSVLLFFPALGSVYSLEAVDKGQPNFLPQHLGCFTFYQVVCMALFQTTSSYSYFFLFAIQQSFSFLCAWAWHYFKPHRTFPASFCLLSTFLQILFSSFFASSVLGCPAKQSPSCQSKLADFPGFLSNHCHPAA